MFRKMRRFAQQLTDAECVEVLETAKRGVLSVIGDDGYPYGVPLDHWYCAENGRIYFHCAREGHKIDAIRACPRVCYTVHDDGRAEEGDWALRFRSVVVFGRARFVEDRDEQIKICSAITRRFTDDGEYLRRELDAFLPKVLCIELTPEHITGKRVKES